MTAEGVVLKQPVLFRDLYRTYAESWRVPPRASLFTGESRIRFGVPTKPFYARDLPREKAARARALCKQAGIENAELFDSCVLDTVLGDKSAAKIFATMPAPRGVIKPRGL